MSSSIGPWCVALLAALAGTAAADPPAAPPPAAAAKDVLHHANAVVRWYRQVQTGNQWLSQPSDLFYWNTQHTLANQAVEAAFNALRAEIPLVAEPPRPPPKAAAAAPQLEKEKIAELAALRSTRVDAVEGEISALDGQIRTAGAGTARAGLAARKAALQSELDYLKSVHDALEKASGLLGGTGPEAESKGLLGQINSLQESIAEEIGGAAPPESAPASAARGVESGGLIARTGALIRLVKYLHGLDHLVAATGELGAEVNRVRDPMRAAIRQTIKEGDQAAEELENAGGGQIASAGRDVEADADRFRLQWAALLPLGQEAAVYERSQHNLAKWRGSISHRETEIARSLAVRVGTIVVLLALVFGLSEIWRRMTLRYAQDERRKRQLFFVRRLATAVLMAAVVAMGFISDLGSLATFAGFLTAGVAVALQTIIVSVAAYFFLVARHGLKVGDRITAGGVTGEVTDIGLVRFYLKELAPSGPDLHPTGRIVTFPNSVIFQANPVFKQLPGTAYTWHETTVAVAPGGSAALVREKILGAVAAAYGEYRHLLEPARGKPEKLSGMKTDLPRPYAHLRARERELELAVGYPVNFDHVSEIDQLVLKHVTEAIAGDESLAKAVSGPPRVGTAVHG